MSMNKAYYPFQRINYPIFIFCFLASYLFSNTGMKNSHQETSGMNTHEIISGLSNVRIPFIANDGQIDESVEYYAKILGQTVYITETNEIVYSLHNIQERNVINGFD